MCYAVKCTTCGKSTWGGCGFHVASVYRQIPEGQHCRCHAWPGVKLNADGSFAAGAEQGSASSCTIL